jgi:tetratricopeptide (TPR) repeat protein
MKNLFIVSHALIFIGLVNNVYSQNPGGNQKKPDSAAVRKACLTTINICTQALKGNNHSKSSLAPIYFLRATAESKLNQFNKAINDYTSSISLNPRVRDAYWNRGLSYEHIKNYPLALTDYKEALLYSNTDIDGSAVLYDNIAIIERKLKQYDKAIEADSMAIMLNPGLTRAYESRGQSYVMLRKYQLAINDFSIAAEGYHDNNYILSRIYFERAEMKRALKQYKDAINDYSFAIKLEPGNKFAYWDRAASYNKNGDYQLANDDYSKAILLYKGDNISLSRLYDDRAQMEKGLQQFNKAIEDDSLAVSLDPKYAAAYWNKADSHTQNGDFRLSNNDYAKTMGFYQNEHDKKALSQLYANVAYNDYFLSDYQKVIDDCTTAVSLDGSSWGPFLNRGRAYLKKMNKELAMTDFKKIIAMDTTKSSDYAFALFYTGDPDKAVEIMQNNLVATTNPYFLLVDYYNMACLLSLMNKVDEANSFLKKCIDGGYPKRYALADGDLDNIRNTDEFKNIISSAVKQ